MKKMLKEAGFRIIIIDYYQGFWIPFKGHIVPKGMIVRAIKLIGFTCRKTPSSKDLSKIINLNTKYYTDIGIRIPV